MRKHQKRLLAILVVMGVAFSGIAFADQFADTDSPGFRFQIPTENQAGGTGFSAFGGAPVAGDQIGGTEHPAFGPPPSFLDVDNDGLVSRDEFPGPEAHFDHLDLNSDGYIDQEEAPKGPPGGPCPPNFSTSGPPPSPDRDNDGLVSREEFPGPEAHFDHFDVNGDGYINEDEVPQRPPEGPRPIAGNKADFTEEQQLH